MATTTRTRQQSQDSSQRMPHGVDETKPNWLHFSMCACIVPILTDGPRREFQTCAQMIYNIHRPFIRDRGPRQCPSFPPEIMSATIKCRRMRHQGLGIECPHILQRAMRSEESIPSNTQKTGEAKPCFHPCPQYSVLGMAACCPLARAGPAIAPAGVISTEQHGRPRSCNRNAYCQKPL